MKSCAEYQHYDLTLDPVCFEKGILSLVEKLRPNWKQGDIVIKVTIYQGFIHRMTVSGSSYSHTS